MALSSGATSPLPVQQSGFALADFVAQTYGAEYLGLHEGEHVTLFVSRDEDKGWAYGERLRDAQRGWFPAAYWQAYPSPSPPSLGHSFLEESHRPRAAYTTSVEAQTQPGGESVYSRGHMLRVRHALSSVPPQQQEDPLCIEMRGPWLVEGSFGVPSHPPRFSELPSRQQERKTTSLEEVLPKLVEVAGGKVKIRNLAAAGLALGVMSGGHAQVCQDIIQVVQARSDMFGPVLEVPASEVSNTYVTLLSCGASVGQSDAF